VVHQHHLCLDVTAGCRRSSERAKSSMAVRAADGAVDASTLLWPRLPRHHPWPRQIEPSMPIPPGDAWRGRLRGRSARRGGGRGQRPRTEDLRRGITPRTGMHWLPLADLIADGRRTLVIHAIHSGATSCSVGNARGDALLRPSMMMLASLARRDPNERMAQVPRPRADPGFGVHPWVAPTLELGMIVPGEPANAASISRTGCRRPGGTRRR
jgi:hypothetical protein